MTGFLFVSVIAQWAVAFLLGSSLLGTLRALGIVRWQREKLQATTPSRIGRDGLKPGAKVPDFTLTTVTDGERSLHDVLDRRVLLVFTRSGCRPCHAIVLESNRILGRGELQVVVVNNGELDETRRWADRAGVRFPVFVQEKFALSKRFEVLATPTAFRIDEVGLVRSKGIVGAKEHLRYVLQGFGRTAKHNE